MRPTRIPQISRTTASGRGSDREVQRVPARYTENR